VAGVWKTSPGRQTQTVHSGSSYCSQSDLALTFGLGGEAEARAIAIDWPSGATERVRKLAAGQLVTIREGAGAVGRGRQEEGDPGRGCWMRGDGSSGSPVQGEATGAADEYSGTPRSARTAALVDRRYRG
jgi:hypothetical protein